MSIYKFFKNKKKELVVNDIQERLEKANHNANFATFTFTRVKSEGEVVAFNECLKVIEKYL